MATWTIKQRLIRSLITLIGLFWIFGVAAAGLVVRHEITEVFDSALRETAGEILPVALQELHRKIAHQSGSPLLTTLASSLTASRGHVHFLLRDRSGAVLLASNGGPKDPQAIPLRKGFYSHGEFRYYARFLRDESIWIAVAQDLQERQEAAIGVWLGLASPLLALLPIAALAVWRTVGRATESISRVANELEARGRNDLEPIDAAGLPAEISPVIKAVNTLMMRLKAALDSERAFAANAAHELRNPIAALRVQIQLLAGNLRATGESSRVESIEAQLGRLSRRVEKLLQMSRAEAGLGHSRERTDLLAIAALIVDDYRQQSGVGRRLRFQIEDDESFWVGMDQDALAIVLRNVIENAIHHGIDTEPIEVRVGRDHTLRVVNACEAVPPHILRELTNRFRRAGARQGVGSGLGLTIVDMIMRQAGGLVALASPAEGRPDGFQIVLKFPSMI
ncbi:ATP-binding protein [Hyphomicrobium sp. CS1GBMeth3]|uniref:sensor histidine kinase n=1 Tax=Hyphomicrobium sp. CS1GBMeth3 TaxID=1892845 RepID=UPI0009310947|nr:ATP-binding protein [Hyphomicrobium sp. CS1GBMeth3]